MDKLKKFGKEISVFGIVIVIVAALFIYKQFNMNDFKYISADKAVSMVEDGKDFIVMFGTVTPNESATSEEDKSKDPANITYEQTTFVKEYIKKNRQVVYYVDVDKIEDHTTFMSEKFGVTAGVPQTLFIKDGKVIEDKSGTALKYVEFSNLVKSWKEAE